MEASALNHAGAAPLRGASPLLRLASDERLVAITRRGNQAAFEALVARYHARLLAFCRHMVSSREDAEDVLQEVFAAAFNAMMADERAINVRPWLYRIARNRSLNHLRRQQPIGVDSMDIHVAEQGATTADKVHKREEFRQLMADVQTLPETQRTALLLREIDALSYEQIAEAMDTTIPSVKSLLVRARVSLAEAAEARTLSCDDVRQELGEVAEGITQRLSAPARRHVRTCERCSGFRKQLRATNKALAAVFPVGPLLFLKKAFLAHLGTTASAGGTAAATTAVAAGSGAGSASVISAGIGAVASKTAAGLAAAALVTAGAVEVNHTHRRHVPRSAVANAAAPAVARPAPIEPSVVAETAQPTVTLQRAGGAQAPTAKTAAEKAGDKPAAAHAEPPAATLPATAPGTPAGGQPQPTTTEPHPTAPAPPIQAVTTPPPAATTPSPATPPADQPPAQQPPADPTAPPTDAPPTGTVPVTPPTGTTPVVPPTGTSPVTVPETGTSLTVPVR